MRLEPYIAELLYRYNCVVVPGFGAFLTQVRSAVIHKASHTFYPPTKTLSFNQQLHSNDGLLVSYMAHAEQLSYEEMLQRVETLAAEWQRRLRDGERLKLAEIGTLWLNSEGKMQFQPTDQVNYLTSSFGLSSFVSAPVVRETLKAEATAMEDKVPFIITPERRKQSGLRPYLKYAAVLAVALTTGILAYSFYNADRTNRQLAREQAQKEVSRHIQEATFFDTAPLELPAVTLDIAEPKTIGRMHHIVAGAFRYKANANKKIAQLKALGYQAAYLGTNDFGLHMVTYDRFEDPEKALLVLREIKRSRSRDAWLLSK